MYSFKNLKPESKEELFKHISSYSIFRHYFGDFEKNDYWCKSPFRDEDDPSFRISFYENEWKYTDFGESPYPKDSIDFVMRTEGLSFYEALEFIYDNISNESSQPIIEKQPNKTFCKINQEFTQEELDYWAKALITKEDLINYNIYRGEIWLNGKAIYSSKHGDLLFIYLFDKLNKIWKGYRPYETLHKRKFFSNNVNNHIQGYDRLPETGDILVITKSYKDIIVWNKLNIHAIAPHTEHLIIDNEIMLELKARFKCIYVNFDNDATGVKNSTSFVKEYQLSYFNIPNNLNSKDPFECVTNHNYELLLELFNEKLKRDKCPIKIQ